MVAVAFALSLLVAALVVSNASWWCAYEDASSMHRRRIEIDPLLAELKRAGAAHIAFDGLMVSEMERKIAEAARERAEAELAAMRGQEAELLHRIHQATDVVDKIQAKLDQAPWNYRRAVKEKMGAQRC